MHLWAVLRTNRLFFLIVLLSFLSTSCVDETKRSINVVNSSNKNGAAPIAAGVNKSVKGTYRGQAHFDLASDSVGYEESFTQSVVISVDKSGRATISLGNKSANLVFDGDQADAEYVIRRSASDYNCSGTIPYTLIGNEKIINGSIVGEGTCSNGKGKHVVQLEGTIKALQ